MTNTIQSLLGRLKFHVARLRNNDKGTATVEYAILLALIALAVALTVPAIGGAITGIFTDTVDALTDLGGGGGS